MPTTMAAATRLRSRSVFVPPGGVPFLFFVLIRCFSAAAAGASTFGGGSSLLPTIRRTLPSPTRGFGRRRKHPSLVESTCAILDVDGNRECCPPPDSRRSAAARIITASRLLLRGGAFDDDDLDSDDESDDFDDDFDFDDFDDLDMEGTDDFGEDNTLTNLLEAYRKTPPLTKAYLTASFGAAMLGYLTNKNDFPSVLQLDWPAVLTRLQIWRPLTAFLNFGPLGLGYVMTVHFVWTYMSVLERLNHKTPYEFWLMMLFGSATMVAGYTGLGMSPRFLGHNLSTFLVYVWSRYHEGLEVNMFELFNTRAEMLPWFFLAQTFLLEGEVPVLDFFGIVFGHIYHHYKSTDVLRTPRFVVQWYEGDGKYARMLREQYKDISSEFEVQ